MGNGEHQRILTEAQPAQEVVLATYVEARRAARGRPLVTLFVNDHVRRAIRKLLDAYTELAVMAPADAPFDEHIDEVRKDLEDYAQRLPGSSVWRMVKSLQTPVVSLAGGGGLTVLGFRLSDLCLCYLAGAAVFSVPLLMVMTLPGAAAQARKLLSAGENGNRAFARERELAGALDLQLRRWLPWDALCWGGVTLWFAAFPSVLGRYAHLGRLPTIAAGGAVVIALLLLVRWLMTDELRSATL